MVGPQAEAVAIDTSGTPGHHPPKNSVTEKPESTKFSALKSLMTDCHSHSWVGAQENKISPALCVGLDGVNQAEQY